jgi:hypothetical protein
VADLTRDTENFVPAGQYSFVKVRRSTRLTAADDLIRSRRGEVLVGGRGGRHAAAR